MKKKGRLTLLAVILSAAVLIFIISLSFFTEEEPYEVTTYSMGSYVNQRIYGEDKAVAAQEAASAVDSLEKLISWRIEESDIQKLNLSAGVSFAEIDPATKEILELCLKVSEESGGAFDPTIAPLSLLWDFDGDPQLPDKELIEEMVRKVDYTSLSILEDGTAGLRKEGTALDLGAVGKGAACDTIVESYREKNVTGAAVSVGGSVGLYGKKPSGELWNISVRNPENTDGMGIISVPQGFISTSGRYEKTFTDEESGETYFHILDPKTGYPAENDLASVTVWCESGAMSDALSTACFVLGMEGSAELLDRMDAHAVFIKTNGEVFITEGLEGLFRITDDSYTLSGVLL